MPSVVLVCSLSRVLDRSVCLLIYPFQDTLTNTKNKPFVHMKRVQFCVYFKVFCRIIHKKSFLVTLMQRKDYSILASSIGGEKVKLTNDRCNKSISCLNCRDSVMKFRLIFHGIYLNFYIPFTMTISFGDKICLKK